MAAILHPTDFSEASRNAFEHALWLAFIGEYELVVLHVAPQRNNGPNWSQFPHIRETLATWGLIEPGLKASDLFVETGLRVKKVNAVGHDPATAVVDYLKRQPADLVVVGTLARKGLDAWLHKSVALSVAEGIRA